MPPKKKRGAKTPSMRKKKPLGKGKTDENLEEDSDVSESKNDDDETAVAAKSHKKFGKFRCLSDRADESKDSTSGDEENGGGRAEECDESEEIVQQLGNLEVCGKNEDVAAMEVLPENLEDMVIPVESLETEVVFVECVAEEFVPECEEQEEYVIEEAMEESNSELLEAKQADEGKLVECVSETVQPIEDVVMKEDSKSSEESEKSSSSDNKKANADKLIPSRKSTRISLKTSKIIQMKAAEKKNLVARKMLAQTKSANKKAKHTKLKTKKGSDSEKETESTSPVETGDSDEVKGNEDEEDDKSKGIAKKGKKVIKKENKPKGTMAKRQIKIKLTPKGKQVIQKKKGQNDEEANTDDDNSIRRSNRIKTISSQKKSSKGKGLVKKESKDTDNSDNSNSGHAEERAASKEAVPFAAPKNGDDVEQKPVKVKSRWRRSSELEMNTQAAAAAEPVAATSTDDKNPADEEVERRLKQFVHLKENHYLTERISCKEAKKMTCDCFLTQEEIDEGEYGCGEDCLNRLLMIECGNLCTVGERCTNKRFQRGQFAPCEVFKTDKKGLGIRAAANIPYGEFILEYVGEVLDPDEFDQRATEYSKDKNQHYYFMSLRADAVIDATQKGNISRFINHSCDPNAETQKWTVNGELRIGFFSKKTILAGEEITFDYQFQRYGKEAQKCFCGTSLCRGWLGEEPEDEDEDEEDEPEEEEEEEGEEEEEEVEEEEEQPEEPAKPAEIKDVPAIVEVAQEVKEDVIPAVESATLPEDANKELSPKKDKKTKVIKPKRKPRIEIFEDLDLDDEIESLQTTGLKNQAHTLKLSRLMVRAKEIGQRTRLLKLLKRGELPCRRLFLDYHGLRLIHGWMTDIQNINNDDHKVDRLRLDILQTLAMLPIANKTMLQDSKVLPTVERWAKSEKMEESPTDSESNSPKVEMEVQSAVEVKPTTAERQVEVKPEVVESDDEFEIRRSVGMDVTHRQEYKIVDAKNIIEELHSIFDDDMDVSPAEEKEASNAEVKEEVPAPVPQPQDDYDVVEEILALAGKLLEEWASLKEVFRIPKRERIEQMKEHEREADRRYKAISLEQENLERKNRENRYRLMQKSRSDDRSRQSDRNINERISKHERRKLFAMQVEQAEVERRRKQQELWRQHVKNCMMMGTDPRFTAPFDPSRGYHCIWNPQIGQWQNYPLPDQSMIFGQAVPMANFPYIPPPGLPQPGRSLTPQVNMPPPNMQHALPTPTNQPLQNTFVPTNYPPPTPQVPQMPQVLHPQQMSSGMGAPAAMQMVAENVASNLTSGVAPQSNSLPQHNMQSHSNVSTPTNIPQGMVPPNITQPNMPPASMGTMPPMPNIPPMPSLPYQEEDPSKVKFLGPIPPPVKLPPKWKCAKDKYGRPYYYHIKIRKSQWEPPELPPEEDEEMSESSSSSETSSLSSDSSSEESESDDMYDDSRLMLEIRNKFKKMEAQKKVDLIVKRENKPSSIASNPGGDKDSDEKHAASKQEDRDSVEGDEETVSSLDKRLKEELGLVKSPEHPPAKKRRIGLVQEIIISPRTEEDRQQFKEDVKRYRQNKEKLRKQKEIIMMQQTKKHLKVSTPESSSPVPSSSSSSSSSKNPKKKLSIKTKLKEMEANSEATRRIKENFRSNMAGIMVGILNPYRKPDCKEGRITNTEDFKHLARKLTHFVMFKELKHCQNIEDLTCTESVKLKAKEFVRKYMSKFGEIYQKPSDDLDPY